MNEQRVAEDPTADVVDVFSRIVCGVDGSEAASAALDQSRRLATQGSRIVVVSVSEVHLAAHAGILATRAAEQIEADARAALEQAGSPELESRLVHGRADEMLLRTAADEHATLVAVGSHEPERGRGTVLGSVATRVVHDAPCSVLVARQAAAADRFPSTIVVGVDGSPSSATAAAVAANLGSRTGASVTILTAMASAADVDERALAERGLAVERRDAKPVPALLEASESADLLVVGSRGLRGLRALGSVSERVAHHARCSLLVVRPPS